MARDEPTLTDTPADGDENKAYPNGIKVLAQAIWQFWPFVSGQSPKRRSTTRDFDKTNFNEIASALAAAYPAAKMATKTASKTLIKIGSGYSEKDKKPVNLTYMHLRQISDYLEIPLSLLILYTHLISLERKFKGDTQTRQEKMERLLQRADLFVAAMRQRLDARARDEVIFVKRYDQKDSDESYEYLADLAPLKEVADQFRSISSENAPGVCHKA